MSSGEADLLRYWLTLLEPDRQKTATDLGEAEQVVDSQTQVIQDLSRKVRGWDSLSRHRARKS